MFDITGESVNETSQVTKEKMLTNLLLSNIANGLHCSFRMEKAKFRNELQQNNLVQQY